MVVKLSWRHVYNKIDFWINVVRYGGKPTQAHWFYPFFSIRKINPYHKSFFGPTLLTIGTIINRIFNIASTSARVVGGLNLPLPFYTLDCTATRTDRRTFAGSGRISPPTSSKQESLTKQGRYTLSDWKPPWENWYGKSRIASITNNHILIVQSWYWSMICRLIVL